jgi:antitoxin component of RelBE/YafQ-DinJ toxin-antitoxin module
VQQIRHNSVYIVGTNYKRMKTQIVAVRITEKQKQQIKQQAQEMGLNSSELVRTHIVKLIEYGASPKQTNK